MNWLRKILAWRPRKRRHDSSNGHRVCPFNRSKETGWAELDRLKASVFWNQYTGIK